MEIIENTIWGNGLSGVGDYQSYLPPGFWDGAVNDNALAGADKDQTIAFTPSGTHSDSKGDWELTTSDAVLGLITVDTDELSCDGNERTSNAGANNNGLSQVSALK